MERIPIPGRGRSQAHSATVELRCKRNIWIGGKEGAFPQRKQHLKPVPRPRESQREHPSDDCRYLPVLPAVPGPCSLARPLQPAWVSCHLTASLWPEPALPSTREPAAPVSSSHTDCWEMSCQPSPQPCGGMRAQCVTGTGCTVPRGTKLWSSQYSVPDNKPAMGPLPFPVSHVPPVLQPSPK